MTMMIRRLSGAILFGAMLVTTVSFAQQPPAPAPVRIRGQIDQVDGDLLQIKARSGEAMKVKLW